MTDPSVNSGADSQLSFPAFPAPFPSVYGYGRCNFPGHLPVYLPGHVPGSADKASPPLAGKGQRSKGGNHPDNVVPPSRPPVPWPGGQTKPSPNYGEGQGPNTAPNITLLALDAGVRETGWAIFCVPKPGASGGNSGGSATGIIRLPRSRSLKAADRVAHLALCLDELVDRWQPSAIAYGQPSGLRWPMPALDLLDAALVNWSARRQLPLYTYSTQEVRAAIARHAHVPQDQLAYAIMARLRLIGQRKTTHEWEALAVGYYHLCRQARRAMPPD